jgi:protein disulfide-isomerase A6
MPLFKTKNVIELTPKNYDLKNKKIIHPKLTDHKGMVAYMAGWCGHCQAFSPTYEKVAGTLGDSFPLFYLDCEKYGDFASKNLGVQGFPTVLYIDRLGKPYKNYSADRTEIAMTNDICNEAKVCGRKN